MEYCAKDTFQPNCKSNEVVVMDQAMYGRYKHGKCITNDIGYCSADILSWMDAKCSGRTECNVKNIDIHTDLLDTSTCADLLPYLKASFICKRGKCYLKPEI